MSSATDPSTGERFSCYLPNLRPQVAETNGSVGSEAEYNSVAFQLDLGLDIELFCDNNALPAESVFQLAWALVLKCFTEKTDVAFDFIETLGVYVSKIHTTIDNDQSAAEAAHALQGTQAKEFSTDVNTLLHVSRGSIEVATDPAVLGSRVQDSHSNVGTSP